MSAGHVRWMGEHNMVGTCPGEDEQPFTAFCTVIGKMDTEVFTPLYKTWYVEVRDGYVTILPDFAHPRDPHQLHMVNLPSDVANDSGWRKNTNGLRSSYLANSYKERGFLGRLKRRLESEYHLQSCRRGPG